MKAKPIGTISGWNYSPGGHVMQTTYPADGSIALFIEDVQGIREATATVCLKDLDLKPEPNHVFLKSWSENTGLVEALVEANIVKLTGKKIRVSAFAEAIEAELMV